MGDEQARTGDIGLYMTQSNATICEKTRMKRTVVGRSSEINPN